VLLSLSINLVSIITYLNLGCITIITRASACLVTVMCRVSEMLVVSASASCFGIKMELQAHAKARALCTLKALWRIVGTVCLCHCQLVLVGPVCLYQSQLAAGTGGE
jgi:hypothetical protein